FDGVIESDKNLTIIDRNLKLENKRYHFPPKYIKYLSYPLPHGLLMKTHKIFRNAINVNSVKYSNTMFANRVYELQAFGNVLLSNFSMGVNSIFLHVFIYNYKTDVPQFLNNTSDRAIREISSAGIRQTMNYETTYHRIKYLYEILGHNLDVDDAKVLVVLKSEDNDADRMVKAQSYKNIEFVYKKELNDVELSPYSFVAYFDNEKYYYEENYIEELVSGFKYADVDFVTKDNSKEKYNYTDNFSDIALTMFDLNILPDAKIDTVKNKVLSGLNIDDTESVLHSELPKKSGKEHKLSVVVQIYNNGRFLENKCLRSLKRQSVYDDMDIIFVNDGSTDEETVNIVNRLIRRNPDIVYYEFEYASGSASTPRNKGVELASTELVKIGRASCRERV